MNPRVAEIRARLHARNAERAARALTACASPDPSLAFGAPEPRCELDAGHAGPHRRRCVRRPDGANYGAATWGDQ